ncbi:hypothetical protein [Aminipila sp.]|uniref:hypothetical protein n=1 Tax=Aminipila sp. TaxID=2060095 RepID=UPI0028A2BE35|nr:hypothetical protein [Aminipila sp.]
MDNFKFTLIGILLFAISTSILYVWGLKKSMKQTATLKEMLLTKGANKVMAYLKKNDSISKKEIQDLVSDIKASEFYSKKTVVVQNEIEFTNTLISFMLDKNLIVKEKNTYCRSK